jgi:CrcB protein
MAGRPRLRDLALVFAGGSVGALARVALAAAVPVQAGRWPWTTFVENIVGAFLLALLLTVLIEPVGHHPRLRLLVCTGALGAFTTYSTLAAEITERLLDGQPTLAAGYGVASVVVGVVAATGGIATGRAVIARRGGLGGEEVP